MDFSGHPWYPAAIRCDRSHFFPLPSFLPLSYTHLFDLPSLASHLSSSSLLSSCPCVVSELSRLWAIIRAGPPTCNAVLEACLLTWIGFQGQPNPWGDSQCRASRPSQLTKALGFTRGQHGAWATRHTLQRAKKVATTLSWSLLGLHQGSSPSPLCPP